MSNKEIAISFLKMAALGNVRDAYAKFIAPEFIHHNQYFKGDRESLMVAMENAQKTHPNKTIDIKNIYQDGDTVITLSEVQRNIPNAAAVAVVHIFRFKGNQVVELWDLGQELMKDSPNENGAF